MNSQASPTAKSNIKNAGPNTQEKPRLRRLPSDVAKKCGTASIACAILREMTSEHKERCNREGQTRKRPRSAFILGSPLIKNAIFVEVLPLQNARAHGFILLEIFLNLYLAAFGRAQSPVVMERQCKWEIPHSCEPSFYMIDIPIRLERICVRSS